MDGSTVFDRLNPSTKLQEHHIPNYLNIKVETPDSTNMPEIKHEIESEEEREKGWSDMTETEASDSDEDESRLVIDTKEEDTAKEMPLSIMQCNTRTLQETARFLEGNRRPSLITDIESEYEDDFDSDEEMIVVSSSGAPDRFRFLTEIFVPKMRGFEELSDRCILDSVSVNLSLDQVVKSSMEQFNFMIRHIELTDTQLEVTKYVRRRARNRLSARKSRMKKQKILMNLASEIKDIKRRKEELRNESVVLSHLKKSWIKRVQILEQEIIKNLKERGDEEAELLIPFEKELRCKKK